MESSDRGAFLAATRAGELACLHAVSDLAGRPGLTPEDWLREVVTLLPAAWQRSHAAGARLTFHDNAYESPGYRPTEWTLSETVCVDGEKAGHLDLCLAAPPPAGEDAFLPDEAALLSDIAARVGQVWRRLTAAKALRDSEERLQLVLRATNDVVWDWDIVRDAQRWNPAGTTVFGWTEIVERDVSAAWWVERVHPDDQQRVEEGFFAVVNDPAGDSWKEEYRFRRADGGYAYVLDRGYVVRDEQGAAVRMIGAMLDVTESRTAQADLEEQARRLAVLNDLAMEMAGLSADASLQDFLVDKLMAVTGATAVAFNNYDEEGKALVLDRLRFAGGLTQTITAPIRKHLAGLRSPVSDEAYRAISERIVATLPSITEASFGAIPPTAGAAMQRALGVDRLVALAYVVEGRLYGTSTAALKADAPDPAPDLLEALAHMGAVSLRRWHADQALKESAEKYRVLFELLPTGVTVADATGQIVEANLAAERILGLTTDAQTQRTIDGDEWSIVRPDGSPMPAAEWASVRALQEQRPVDGVEMGVVRGSGETVWLSVNAAPLPDDRVTISYDDITEHKRAQEEIVAGAQRLRTALHDTVRAMGTVVALRDPYTGDHQQRATLLADRIGEELGLDETRLEGLHLAGQVHDIGKIGVPAEILAKPGALTETEFRLIKLHPALSGELLAGIAFEQPVATIVRQHHERLDGSGYPDGLEGDQILLEARILAVADVVEAMASHRPYRPALGIEAALDEVRSEAGVLYDPEVVAACERLIAGGFGFLD